MEPSEILRLETSNEELRKINDKLEPLILEEGFEAEYNEAVGCDDAATVMIGRLQARLRALNINNGAPEAAPPSSPEQREAVLQAHGVKLPKLRLETFDDSKDSEMLLQTFRAWAIGGNKGGYKEK
ncbi:hypothetical protein MTO96_039635 [Rhipicephalus appendiculatus]